MKKHYCRVPGCNGEPHPYDHPQGITVWLCDRDVDYVKTMPVEYRDLHPIAARVTEWVLVLVVGGGFLVFVEGLSSFLIVLLMLLVIAPFVLFRYYIYDRILKKRRHGKYP